MCPPAALLTLAVCAGLLGALAWYLPGIARGLPRAVVRLATVGVPEEFPHASVRALMGGLLVLIAQFGLGYLLLARVPAWRRSLPRVGERAALAPLVGLLPLGLGVLAMGLTGYASPVWLTLALIVVLIALGLPGLREFNRDADPSLRPTRARRRWREQPALLVTAILLGVLTLLYALAPPSESDELRYHLAAPATWLRLGGIHYLPWQAFSCFPFLAEMLFMAAMAAGGPAAAKVVHFAQLPLGAGLVALWTFELGRFAARDTRRTAKLAALGYATIPMALVLSAWGFIDLFVVNIYLGFGYVALRGLRAPRRAAPTLLGWMGAGALGLKYTMGPLMLAGGALWLVLRLVRRGGRPWRDAAACALVAAVLGSPFYVKNYRDTGNPVYPLAWGVSAAVSGRPENDALFAARRAQGDAHGGDPGIAARVGELLRRRC